MTKEQQILERYKKSPLYKRLVSTELSAINHGFNEWEGETVIDFLTQAMKEVREDERKTLITKFKNCITPKSAVDHIINEL